MSRKGEFQPNRNREEKIGTRPRGQRERFVSSLRGESDALGPEVQAICREGQEALARAIADALRPLRLVKGFNEVWKTIGNASVEVDLGLRSVKRLGFSAGATYAQICARIDCLGFSPCPDWIGDQFVDQSESYREGPDPDKMYGPDDIFVYAIRSRKTPG